MHLNRSADLASCNFTLPFWLTGFSKYGQAHNAHQEDVEGADGRNLRNLTMTSE
jgi:hypothetical protein